MIFSSSKVRALARRAAGLIAAAGLLAAVPDFAAACACGCSVFDVQTGGMLPNGPGGLAFVDYDFLNQKQNWGGPSKAPDDQNDDKQLRTHFVTVGAQYMFDRSWGVSAALPLMNRYFKTTDDDGSINGYTRNTVGDAQVKAVYTGFSPDMSTGLTFGLQLPTGDWTYKNFDRDTESGTGSTELILGAFHQGALTSDNRWSWFVNGQWVEPTLTQAGYRPGSTIDAVAGAYFNDWTVGGVKISPLAQAIGSVRWRDSGTESDSPDTGYRRVLLGPGVEVGAGAWHVFADVGFPVAQYVNGDQLVAAEYFKFSLSRSF
jgi:hypothetical protein